MIGIQGELEDPMLKTLFTHSSRHGEVAVKSFQYTKYIVSFVQNLISQSLLAGPTKTRPPQITITTTLTLTVRCIHEQGPQQRP